MKGARLPSWSSPTTKSMTGTLARGTAILDDRGNFIDLPFPPLARLDRQIRVVDAARVGPDAPAINPQRERGAR